MTTEIRVPEFSVNDALAGMGLFDPRVCRVLEGHEEPAGMLELLSLFSLLEAIALHETLWVWTEFRPGQRNLLSDSLSNDEQFWLPGELIDQGVIKLLSFESFVDAPENQSFEGIFEWTDRTIDRIATRLSMRPNGVGILPFDSLHHALMKSVAISRLLEDPRKLELAISYKFDWITCYQDLVQPGVIENPGELSSLTEEALENSVVSEYQTIPRDVSLLSTFASRLQLDYCASAWEMPFVVTTSIAPQLNMIRSLYGIVDEQLRGTVDQLVELGTPVTMYIPPIPALVLDYSKRKGCSLLVAVMEVREQFARFRAAYAKHKLRLRSGELSISAGIKLRKEFFAEVGAMLEELGGATESTVLSDVFQGSASEQQGDMDLTTSMSVNGAAKFGKKLIHRMRVRRRAQVLFDLWGKVSRMEQYASLVENRLGWRVPMSDIKNFERFAAKTKATLDSPTGQAKSNRNSRSRDG